jgi:hypothetical protein
MTDESSAAGPSGRAPMSLDRFRMLLDSYGARADRWPDSERQAALALLASSQEAERLCRNAARVDAAIDLLPAEPPSSELMARVLAGAPGARPAPLTRRWRRSAAAVVVPLAAAAALLIWVVTGREVASNPPAQIAIGELGVYTTPTDVLLEPSWIDVSSSNPALGCADDDLGCPSFELPPERQSLQPPIPREYA